jgi:hypothetical protein
MNIACIPTSEDEEERRREYSRGEHIDRARFVCHQQLINTDIYTTIKSRSV